MRDAVATVGRAGIVAGALVALAGLAAAHGGFDTVGDVPIPPGLLYGGAAATVLATALLVADDAVTPRIDRRLVTLPPRVAATGRRVVRATFLLAVAVALVDGLVGPRNYLLNGATLVVWPLLVEGVALWSVLAGSPWRTISPWRTVHDVLSAVEGAELRLRPYPDWLGRWPALVGYLLLVGVVANLTRVPFDPRATAAVLAGYALVTILGGVVFGRAWFAHADPLAVLFELLGRAAPLSVDRTPDGGRTLVASAPWTAAARPVRDAATAAFVVAAVYTVSFDGFVESPVYGDLYAGLRTVLGPAASVPIYLAGLACFLVAFVATARLTARLAGVRSDDASTGTNATDAGAEATAETERTERTDGGATPVTAVAGTLVPIAAGYEVAHNWSFVVTVLGLLPRAAALGPFDPGRLEPLAWLPVEAVWGSQVALIVLGHVVAVVAAHAATADLAGPDTDPGTVLRAHAPLLAVMIGYTILSLWIVSLPAS